MMLGEFLPCPILLWVGKSRCDDPSMVGKSHQNVVNKTCIRVKIFLFLFDTSMFFLRFLVELTMEDKFQTR